MADQEQETQPRFVVRECGPAYDWLPPWCVVDTEKRVRCSAYSTEADARQDAEARNTGKLPETGYV